MKKIILTKDIIIDTSDITPGKRGEVVLIQDSVGYHQITLQEPRNIGVVEIGFQPGTITILKYVNDDEHTYWTSEVVTSEIPLNPPSTITDLTVVIVDDIGVKVRFTAPQRNPPTDIALNAVDKYHFKVTESVLDGSTNAMTIKSIVDFKVTVQPKLPGETEEVVLSGLLPGHKYYVSVLSSATIYGRTRQSEPSNIVSFYTAFLDTGNTTTPQRIPLNKDRIYDWMLPVEYDTKEVGHRPLEADVLADYTGIIDNNGVPFGEPHDPLGCDTRLYGFYHPDWYNMPALYSDFDLERNYNIDSLYIITPPAADGSDNGGFGAEFQVSSDGVNFITIGSRDESYSVNLNNWYKIEIDKDYTSNVRYFRIAWVRGEGRITGLVLYGNLSEKYDITGIKFKRNVPTRTFSEKMGINCFLQEGHPEYIAKVASTARLFTDGNWVMSDVDGFVNPGPIGWNSTPDDIVLQLEGSRMWNFDAKLQQWKDLGMMNLFCITNEFPYMRDATVTPNPIEAKPIDPQLNNRDITVTTNPQSYKHYARIAYNLAARYGKNPNADTQYIQLNASDSPKRGLDLVQYYTAGNERDANWADEDRFNTASEIAARMSAFYDGHKGALGPGFGLKAADPDAKLTLSAIYYCSTVGYTHETLKWWDLHRGYRDYPIAAFDLHLYNTHEDEINAPMYSSIPRYALPPEKEQYWRQMPKWIEFRDTYAPNQEFWITEIGYDEQNGGTNAPNYPTQFERSRYKAYWMLRTFFLNEYIGLDMCTMYWYANTTIRLEELNPNNKTRDTFLTSGITDGVLAFNDWVNRKPLMTWWYLAGLKQDMTGYSYSHAVVIYGEQRTTTTIIPTINPKLFCLAFKNNDTGDTALALWIVDAEMNKQTININVDTTETSVDVLSWEGAELRGGAAFTDGTIGGVTTSVPALSNSGQKYITVQVGECPILVKTKNIGIGKLVAPYDFRTQAVSIDAIKLAWVDKNIGTNNVRIYQSLDSGSNFNIIFNGYVDNGEYEVTGLDENTAYYYCIQFADGDKISDVSEVRGNTTLLTIPIPANLRNTAVTTSTIDLAWDYTNEQQALIDGFEIYRSMTVNGTYTLLSSIASNRRSFKDVGLVDGTTYYYKIRAKKEFLHSDFSLALGLTTALPNADTPLPTDAIITYAGDEISIRMDKTVKDVAGNQSAFSVIKDPTGTPELINVASTYLDSSDAGLIHLRLTEAFTGGETVTVSYDWTLGTMKSTFDNGAVDSWTDFAITNYANDPTLLSKRVKVNFRGTQFGSQGESPNGSGWNDVTLPAQSSVKQFQGTLLTDTGAASGYRWLLPYSQYPTYYGNWDKDDFISWDSTSPPVGDPIDNYFPSYTRVNGVSYYTNELMAFQLSGLDTTKEYNVRVFTSCDNELDANNLPIMATLQTVSADKSFTWRIGRGHFDTGILSAVKAGNGVLQGVGTTAFETTASSVATTATPVSSLPNNIAFTLTQGGAVKVLYAALIIEELIPVII